MHSNGFAAKPQRRARPSRARGLRTNTGCLTCRRRRVKCDEAQPRCGQCAKAQRECGYGGVAQEATREESQVPTQPYRDSSKTTRALSVPSTSPSANSLLKSEQRSDDVLVAARTSLSSSLSQGGHPDCPRTQEDLVEPVFSPVTEVSNFSAGAAPFNWFQLLANDVATNVEEQSLLTQDPRWDFDPATLLNLPSHGFGIAHTDVALEKQRSLSHGLLGHHQTSTAENAFETVPWRTPERTVLSKEEASYLTHFVKVIGPMIDLFDPLQHFTNYVPHLAMRNTGLLKSMLAVAARHLSLNQEDAPNESSDESGSPSNKHRSVAFQCYCETLHYLSTAMQYQSYTCSLEILATALMISTYEMFDGSNRNWERHLKGVFWIQRSQDNDGESGGLRQAVWWAWLRQDIWAAFRDHRRTLTIWRPKKPLHMLNSHELASRVLFLLAKAVDFTTGDSTEDYRARIQEGDNLLLALEDWRVQLPRDFLLISYASDSDNVFKPMWINPPSFAAALQTYSFARLLIVLSKPTTGGIMEHRNHQMIMAESIETICGLAQSPAASEPPSAFVNAQCLFAAGFAAQSKDQQIAIASLLRKALNCSRWPPVSLLADLNNLWKR